MKVHQTDCDLLSDLPLGIIHIILTLIPFREAVRTCILSRQWRYIWTSLPELVFDKECATNADNSKSNYADIINRILFRHTGPIHKFKLHCCQFPHQIPIFEEWIYFLSRNGIKEIILESKCEEYWLQLLHSSIFSCGNLTSLKLVLCKLDPLPLNFKGFFSLKSLNLNRVKLQHNGVGRLVSVCPFLERLTVIEFRETELNIRAPNLKYLQLSGDCMKICLDAPLLAEMEVELEPDVNVNNGENKQQICNCTHLLGGVTDLEKLAGSCDFSEYLSIGIDSCHNYLVFHHLKSINLDHVHFEEAKEISLLSRLLIGAPNLLNLKLTSDDSLRPHHASGLEAPHLSFGVTPFFKLEKLRVVTLEFFSGLPMEMELIKILLECSPLLEKMSVKFQDEIISDEQKKKEQQLRDELMSCSSASPNAKLNFL